MSDPNRGREFSLYDSRHYPMLAVREGYGAWAPTYDDTVLDLMDLRVAERLTVVDWADQGEALDLACGTGRAGAWLKTRGVAAVDGVDLTPQMLARAEARGVYRRLLLGEVTGVALPDGAYGLVTMFLADEHLPSLGPLYAEAARLALAGGSFVLVGYHPWFLMGGMAAHFEPEPGQPVAIESYVHLFADHVAAARAAGWRLDELVEAVIDEAWIAAKPKWAVHRERPISFAMAWRKA